MPKGRPIQDYRIDIDGLRGLAILLVVGYHAFPGRLAGGFIGVDVFFVISGFLISNLILKPLQEGTFGFIDFYSRRIRRIFPALLIVLFSCAIAGWFLLNPIEYKQLGKHIAASAAFTSNIILSRENGYFDNSAETKPLWHLWSLGIEEQFYLVWPLLLWLAASRRWNAFSITTGIALLSFSFNAVESYTDATAAFYSPLTRAWELMAGAALAARKPPGLGSIPKLWRELLSCAGLAGIIFAALYLNKYIIFPGWWVLLPILGSMLIIGAGSEALINRLVLSNRVLVWFGLISYPLYLWHWPILSFLRILEAGALPLALRILAIAVSVALSWAVYKFVELPIRFGRFLKAKTALLLAVGLTATAAGLVLFAKDGLPSRFHLDLLMDESHLHAERQRYWSQDQLVNYDEGHPRVVLLGDSQAYDVFAALKNDPRLGLKLFWMDWRCRDFLSSNPPFAEANELCSKGFTRFLNSPEIRTAQVLIYATSYYPDPVKDPNFPEEFRNYDLGLRAILQKNPNIKILFFGRKPVLGEKYVDINAILRGQRTPLRINQNLRKITWIPKRENRYTKRISDHLGATFVDTYAIFCQNGCNFIDGDKLAYFDQVHWTQTGAKMFYDRFARTQVYKQFFGTKP